MKELQLKGKLSKDLISTNRCMSKVATLLRVIQEALIAKPVSSAHL